MKFKNCGKNYITTGIGWDKIKSDFEKLTCRAVFLEGDGVLLTMINEICK